MFRNRLLTRVTVVNARAVHSFAVRMDDLLILIALNLPPLRVIFGLDLERRDALLRIRMQVEKPFPEIWNTHNRERQNIPDVEEKGTGHLADRRRGEHRDSVEGERQPYNE